MAQERITHIKMADGTLAPVEYKTNEAEWPEDIRNLANAAREASRAAIARLLSKGIPVVYVVAKDLIRHYPDGHDEIIKKDLLP